MKIKGIMDTNFQDYKEISFYIGFPACTLKCEQDCSKFCCSNRELLKTPNIEISAEELVKRYLDNKNLVSAVVCGGLDPIDSFTDLIDFISTLRKYSDDTVVIYTGYYKEEIDDKVEQLKKYKNIIMKFGRFIPDTKNRYDEVLGITLASDNQYAEKIS